MISVITPVYNGERFIESCIKVVIQQHCPAIEHIIIDGDSSDGTLEIVKRYAEKFSHIRWLSEADKGQSDAMNKGITMAKGDIVSLLNVDDYYEPSVLNRVLEIFKTLPEPSLLVGNCNVWNNEGALKFVNKPRKLSLLDLVLITPVGTPLNQAPCNPSAYFYHKSLHQKAGLYEVEEHYSMDLDFILRAVQIANVKYIDETWGNFRLIEGTKTLKTIEKDGLNQRIINIFKKYRARLSLSQKFILLLKQINPMLIIGFSFYSLKKFFGIAE